VEIHREVQSGGWAATAATVTAGTPTLAGPVTVPETLEPLPPPGSTDSFAPDPALPVRAGATLAEEPRAMSQPATASGPLPAPSHPRLSQRAAGSSSAAVVSSAAAPSSAAAVAGAAVVDPAVAASEAPEPAGSSTEFGAAEVERGRTSTLRMSAPIQAIEGHADGSGFTVTVRGALSLDRAAPIAASNPSIERASILNLGDHCVLTIRFVSGRSPQYRVVARGAALDVVLGR
jgi:hypothetical protein